MPVTDKTIPNELKLSLEKMESSVQKFKDSLSYSAPELYDLHYSELQVKLAGIIIDLYETNKGSK